MFNKQIRCGVNVKMGTTRQWSVSLSVRDVHNECEQHTTENFQETHKMLDISDNGIHMTRYIVV